MNTTVTLAPAAYKNAERLAKSMNLTVEETMNKVFNYEIILTMPIEKRKKSEVKQNEVSTSWDELLGCMADVAPNVTDEELREEYMQRKYGI